jgi:hypothetical protein
MIDYTQAKPSFFIEDQLPQFVRRDGARFIDFLKTYYDWLERRFVILTLKSKKDFDIEEIIGKEFVFISKEYLLQTEDESFIIIPEDFNEETYLENNYSINFDGINQHGDINHQIFDITSDWSLSLWFNPSSFPSDARSDLDIITVSNASYVSLLKLSQIDNKISFNVDGENDISTEITTAIKTWNFIAIRYNSTSHTLSYNCFNEFDSYSYSTEIDLSSVVSNRFVLGCDLYNSRNFYNGYIDEISIWDEVLGDEEIDSMYNNGFPIDLYTDYGDYSSNNNIINYFRFEEANSNTAINLANTSNNLDLYHDPSFLFEVPSNLGAISTEQSISQSVLLNIISGIKYDIADDDVMANRALAFSEYDGGEIVLDGIIFETSNGAQILIDSYIETKNCLNIINNLSNYQEIDYNLSYKNFVFNEFFKNSWREIMHGFPLFLHATQDQTIKHLIAKTINEFYASKGTYKAIRYLFLLLYNEDLVIGTDIYTDGAFTYVIKTRYARDKDVESYLKEIVHPVGFKYDLQLK